MALSKPLSEIKKDLKVLLDSNDVASSIIALQQLLPNNAEKKSQTLLLEGYLTQLNRDNLRGLITVDYYQIGLTQICDAMFDLITGLEEQDFDPATVGTPKQSPVSVVPKFVIIYDQADHDYCRMLNKHLNLLKITKKIYVYNVNEGRGGEILLLRAKQEIEDADYLLALVTVNLFNSPDWFELVFNAMGDGRHIILIRMEQADYEGSGLENLESFPSQNRAVSDFTNTDHAYIDIVTGIRKLLSN